MGLLKPAGGPYDDDDLQERALQAGVAAAKRIVGDVAPRTRLADLSDVEWGWIVSATLAAWICERSKVLSERGLGQVERLIVSLKKQDPEPWEEGAVSAALPILGEVAADLNIVEKPLGEWSKDDVIAFAWTAFRAVEEARVARDERQQEDIPF